MASERPARNESANRGDAHEEYTRLEDCRGSTIVLSQSASDRVVFVCTVLLTVYNHVCAVIARDAEAS